MLLIFAGVSLLTRLLALHPAILNVDEASYMVGARELLAGKLPYIDFADNKPPLIYAYYALAQLLIGHGIVGVRLLTNLVTVPLTALAVSAFYGHDRRGLVAGILFLIFSAAYVSHDMLAVNCELVMLLPMAWALVCVRDQDNADRPVRMFITGVLLGIAVLIKYQAGLWLPAIAAAGFTAGSASARARPLAALATGFVIPLAATVAVFASLHALDAFIYWNVTHNVVYVENPITPIDAVLRIVTRLGPFLAVTTPLWIGCFRLPWPSYRTILIGGVTTASLVACFLGLRMFPHYFVLLYLPLAIGAAPWAADLLAPPLDFPARAAVGVSMAALVGFTAVNVWLSRPNGLYEESRPVFVHVADRLRADPCYGRGPMFVWGYASPLFHYYSGLPVASRYFFAEYPLVEYFPGNPDPDTGRPGDAGLVGALQREQLQADLEGNAPVFLLDTAPANLFNWNGLSLTSFPWLHRFVRLRYNLIDSIDGVDVYRRRGC